MTTEHRYKYFTHSYPIGLVWADFVHAGILAFGVFLTIVVINVTSFRFILYRPSSITSIILGNSGRREGKTNRRKQKHEGK